MGNDLYWYYQTHSCTTAALWFLLSQLCIGNPCQYNAAAYNMSLHHSFLLTEKSLWGDTADFLCSYGKQPLAQELLHQKLPCPLVCKLHPSKQGLGPQSSDPSASSPFNLTSYYFLPEAWESGRGQCIKFKRGISRFIKSLLFIKEKKTSKPSPSHHPSQVSPGK